MARGELKEAEGEMRKKREGGGEKKTFKRGKEGTRTNEGRTQCEPVEKTRGGKKKKRGHGLQK